MRAIVLAVGLIGSAAPAAVLMPTSAEIAEATRAGVALAAPHEGYLLKDYAVYAVKDSRTIDPANGLVDAVVLATPLERTRHAAFLATYAGKSVTPAQAQGQSGLRNGEVRFVVYAHGATAGDDAFVGGFSAAQLAIGGRTLEAAPVAGSVSLGTYPLVEGDRFRFVAAIRYTFDLSGVPQAGAGKGTLKFTDAGGKVFDLPVDLEAYR